jgi:hypothetical protein
MSKNEFSDPITDQEMAFAGLVLFGAMTDRRAAEAVGLHPDAAAYTKAKPCVRAYMLEHRAAVQQQLLQQEADPSRPSEQAKEQAVEGQPRLNPDRQQVLDRLWEIAQLSPEMTRNSVTGQVKTLSMIIAMQNFIPDRRAVSSEKKAAPVVTAQIYQAAWLRKQQAANPTTTNDPQPDPAPSSAAEPPPNSTELSSRLSRHAAEPAVEPAASPVPSQPTFASRVPLAENVPPYLPPATSVPDTRVPFSIKKNPFNPFVRPR